MPKVTKAELKATVVEVLVDFISGKENLGLPPIPPSGTYPQEVERVTIETDNDLLDQITPFIQHKLGLKYRDKLSGFVGIADSVHIYLNGCERYSLQGAATTDGKIPGFIFDGNTMELVSAPQEEPVPAGMNRGGPPTPSGLGGLDTHDDI